MVKVKSQSGSGNYDVDIEALTCTCPHFQYRMKPIGGICKHIQQVLNETAGKHDDAIKFIKHNTDAVAFVEKYGEEILQGLKRTGQVLEYRGKLWLPK